LLKPRYLPAGESALVVEFGDTIDPKIHDQVLALDAALQQAKWEGVTETVPTYRSLMIHFDPRRLTTEALADALAGLDYASAPPRTRRQPGTPLPATIRRTAGTSPKSRHSLVCLRANHRPASRRALPCLYVWFCAGIHVSRRTAGRTQNPAAPCHGRRRARIVADRGGAGALIASCAMPTGWYGIGRTPVKMFDPAAGQDFLAGIGDELCFERIDPAAFDAMSTTAEAGEFCARHEYLDET
jgi:allophanate hydrolase subunit 1